MTQHYARVLDNKIGADMQLLKEKLSLTTSESKADKQKQSGIKLSR